VFTADPRIVPTARRIDRISYDEMLEMAAAGAKILHLRCVEYARRYALPIHVRSSFSTKTGTWIVEIPPEEAMEAPIISGVAHERGEAKITVVGVPDKPGEAAQIFTVVADAGVNRTYGHHVHPAEHGSPRSGRRLVARARTDRV
jgi:aspartate kinase